MKKVLTISFLALFVFTGFAYAQTNETAKEKIKNKVAETKREINGKNCEIIQERVQSKVEIYQEKQQNQLQAFTKIRNKLQRFIDRANQEGYQTEALATQLADYDTKVTKFNSDYEVYLKLLSETKEYSCEKSSVEFKTKLRAAREQLKVVKRDAVELKTFYAKNIRPELVALKKAENEVEKSREGVEDEAR